MTAKYNIMPTLHQTPTLELHEPNIECMSRAVCSNTYIMFYNNMPYDNQFDNKNIHNLKDKQKNINPFQVHGGTALQQWQLAKNI